jgi:ribonucleoside-diphosphate reductase alpha chain
MEANSMKLTDNALKVLKKRYLAKDEDGHITETPEDMFDRVARTIAADEKKYKDADDTGKLTKEFYDMMTNLDFLPNSPTLMNAGRPLGQLSACFVLPVGDSMEEIFDAIKYAAIIHKSGGGTGFSFSRLRPKGATVRTTGGVASGPVSFMKVFNSATEAVKQGGTRRGANMGILRVDHPDILEFIKCKQDNNDITNFNISVGITEKFINAVQKDEYYSLVDPHTKEIVKTLRAREVFDLIVDMAWNNGEPGIVFLDRINEKNPVPGIGEIESTNPCGEQPLLPYESCNLGSINLANMLKYDKNEYIVDYKKLKKVVFSAVHFLDNVIDVNCYPLPQIDEMTQANRKIGLGVMGFADMLYRMKVPYNSKQALKLADEIMTFIDKASKEASCELAKKRGIFPNWDKSIFREKNLRVRNATTTTIAPTGTISIIAGVSSGIEPAFALAFVRKVMDNEELLDVNPIFKDMAVKRGFYNDSLMRRVSAAGTLKGLDDIPDDIKKVYVTALDTEPYWHISMQAAFQKHVDNAVSKTVNFPNKATKDDVRRVYLMAYDMGCKGVTIYRDGSRDTQVLNIGDSSSNKVDIEDLDEPLIPRERPQITRGITEKVRVGCGNLYITVNYDENGICEVFTNVGRAGGCPSQSEATSRLTSVALRSGMDVKELVGQLKGIRCLSTIRQKERDKRIKVLSCPDAIARVIEKVMDMKDETNPEDSDGDPDTQDNGDEKDQKGHTATCPECGSKIEHESGCVICPNCGYSKCS